MKQRIIKTQYQRLRNEEWFLMHTFFKDEAMGYGAMKLSIDRLFAKYVKLYAQADETMEKVKKSFLTKVTTTEDEHRSQIYRGIRENVRSLRNYPDPAMRQAAEELYNIIENYAKSIIAANLASKTAAIDNLLQDLTGDKGGEDMTAQVTQLGIESWVQALRDANEAYKATREQRFAEAENKPEPGRLVRLRAEMDHLYVLMLRVIDAQLEVIEDQDSDNNETVQFVKALNARLAYFKTLLEQRKTKKANANVDEDKEEEED